MNMHKIIARNLKKLREATHYTQNEMASAIGITCSAYSNYESGEREVPYDVIEKASLSFPSICRAEWLWGCQSQKPVAENYMTFPEFSEIILIYFPEF